MPARFRARLLARLAGLAGLARLAGLLFAGFFGLGADAVAQNVVRWTTNYYSVTGATVREIRRSLNTSRPWRNRETIDAATTWRVEWKFGMDTTAGGCRISDVSTVTTITTTLPRYIPSTNAPAEVVQRWVKYFGALARHEAVHGEIAKAAGVEIQGALAAHSASDCPNLRHQVEAAANSILTRRRREEKEMDVRTQHGGTEGARFP